MKDRNFAHYAVIAMILVVSGCSVRDARGQTGAVVAVLPPRRRFHAPETKRSSSSRCQGSTWVVASLAIASVLGMALVADPVVAHREIKRPELSGSSRWRRSTTPSRSADRFESRPESLFYAVLEFSLTCAPASVRSAIQR
jgi:hypothetical protein